MMKKGLGKKGFTLIELLVVLALIAILAAVAVPNVIGYIAKGEERAWSAEQKTIQAAVDAYYSAPDNPRYQGKRQYAIYGQGALTPKVTGADPLESDFAATHGDNPDRGTVGNTPLWDDDDGDGRRDAVITTEGWDRISVTKGITTYWFSSGNAVIDVAKLVTGGYMKVGPVSASKDNLSAGTGSYTWYVDATGLVHSLLYTFPIPTNTDFVKGFWP